MSDRPTTRVCTFSARVRDGGQVLGTFVKLAGLETIDLAARAGFDFVVVDLEHSQLSPDAVAGSVRHATAIDLPVLVRLPEVDAGAVNRLLEAGAAGIQVSSITTARQALALRRAMRYPPEGTRSVSVAQPSAGYGARSLAGYLEATAASPPLVVGQIETATTEDPLEQVLAHLDVAFVGTTDLSVDLGVPGLLESPGVVGRVEEIARAAAGQSVMLGGWAAGPERADSLHEKGASYVVIGSDLDALRRGLTGMTRVAPAPSRETR